MPVNDLSLFDVGSYQLYLSNVGGEVRKQVSKCSMVSTDHYLHNETPKQTHQPPDIKYIVTKSILTGMLSFIQQIIDKEPVLS